MNRYFTTIALASPLLFVACWPESKPTPTPTPINDQSTKIDIIHPAEGTSVNQTELVKGTSQAIPNNNVVWVVLFVHKVGRFYPQNRPADIQANGDWASVSYVGVPKDIGLKFDVIAVSADKAGQNAFNAYLADARDRNDYAGLERIPDGATIHDRVTVTRK